MFDESRESVASILEEEGNKEKSKQSVHWIRFKNFTFNLYEFRRLEELQSYDPQSEFGQSYDIKFYLSGYPFEKIFKFRTEEDRNLVSKDFFEIVSKLKFIKVHEIT